MLLYVSRLNATKYYRGGLPKRLTSDDIKTQKERTRGEWFRRWKNIHFPGNGWCVQWPCLKRERDRERAVVANRPSVIQCSWYEFGRPSGTVDWMLAVKHEEVMVNGGCIWWGGSEIFHDFRKRPVPINTKRYYRHITNLNYIVNYWFSFFKFILSNFK